MSNGRADHTPHATRKKPALTPVRKLKKHFLQWIPDGYKAGLIGLLLIFDLLAFCVVILDLFRFYLSGRELPAAGRLAWEIVAEQEVVGLSIGTFAVLLFIVPFAVALLSHVLSRSSKRQTHAHKNDSEADIKYRKLNQLNNGRHFQAGIDPAAFSPEQRTVLKWHALLALVISLATVYAIAMQRLAGSGSENQDSFYSFNSYWFVGVSKIHYLLSAVGFSALLKYAARLLGHEHETFEDTITEVSTELPVDK